MKTRGIIYVATGAKYLAEALVSAASARAVMPGIPMSLWTDQEVPAGLFENVFPAVPDERGRVAKMRAMASSPYEETLFLDSDTLICQPFEDIFLPLARYDIAIAHEVYRNEYKFEVYPESFPALNTGVVAYRNTEKVRELFRAWEESYMTNFRYKPHFDPPAFRHTLFHSDLLHYILPPEFNFRTNYPVVLGGFSRVKILHDRTPFIRELARLLGDQTSPRPVYYGPITRKYFGHWFWYRFRTILRRIRDAGFLETLNKVRKRVMKRA